MLLLRNDAREDADMLFVIRYDYAAAEKLFGKPTPTFDPSDKADEVLMSVLGNPLYGAEEIEHTSDFPHMETSFIYRGDTDQLLKACNDAAGGLLFEYVSP